MDGFGYGCVLDIYDQYVYIVMCLANYFRRSGYSPRCGANSESG